MPTRQASAYNTLTHFVLLPILTLTFGLAIYLAAHAVDHKALHWWLAVVAFALLLLNLQTRSYSLRVQDRVIRLEERLRIAALVPDAELDRLTLRQLIALRFASDGELPALVRRSLKENLDPATIKDSITSWRTDDIRI